MTKDGKPNRNAPVDPADQLLEDGQEEVFSRAEVEVGRIEHQAKAGNGRQSETPSPAADGVSDTPSHHRNRLSTGLLR